MKPEELIKEVEGELSRLGIAIRRERGNFRGGWCVINDERFLMLNRRQSAEVQFSILAEAVRSLPLDSIYIKPNLRKALEDSWSHLPLTSEADEPQNA